MIHSKNEFIAMDMGGTKVHIALVKDGKIISESNFPTSAYKQKSDLLDAIIKTINAHFTHNVRGIGVGVPGLVDQNKGVVYDIQNIKDWNQVPLKDILMDAFPVEVSIANDANLFALGENVFGEGRNCQNLLGIALGTGIGCGIILNGKPYTGKISGAGEIGSIPYLDQTIEDYCSGKFFLQFHQYSGEHFARLAVKNEPNAVALFNEFGTHLGKMIKLLLFVLAPDTIVFGGSISKSFHLFEGAMRKELEDFPFNKVIETLQISPSKLSNAALLGAAYLAQDNYEKEAMVQSQQ